MINERFDTLQRIVEEARAEALNGLDASFADQEQRLTFDISTSKAHKGNCVVAMRQAQDAYSKFCQTEQDAQLRHVFVSATAAEPAEELGERLQRSYAEVDMPVRHIRGVRVFAGRGEPFEAAAALVRGLASDARAEHTDEPAGAAVALLHRSVSTPALEYRRSDRKFLVLSAATEKRALDVCAKIRSAVGRCYVDNFKANETLISLEDLGRYDAVLVWVGGCTGFAGGAGFGSVLARYAAAGGGVVVCPWSLATDDDGEGLRGEVVDSGILGTHLGECISGTRLTWGDPARAHRAPALSEPSCNPGEDDVDDALLLLDGAELDGVDGSTGDSAGLPRHPLLNGVHYIDGGDYSGHHSLSVSQDSDGVVECAAMWSDGTPLAIVARTHGDVPRYNTAVVNLYPVSSDFSVRCWNTSTDFAILLANALHLVSKPV